MLSQGLLRSEGAAATRRTTDEMEAAGRMLRPFHSAGYRLFLLKAGAKTPVHTGWQTRTYSAGELKRWLAAGGNIGIALTSNDLILDVDPRHDGLASIVRLQNDLGVDLSSAPSVLSGRGDGGRHLYFRKPPEQHVRKGHPSYPGIDVKTGGGLVVAPGSRHPSTGGLYTPDPAHPSIIAVNMAPPPLLQALKRAAPAMRSLGGGELSVEQLKVLLAALDPRAYRDYPHWFRFGAACHDATNGEGRDCWLEWAARDPEYGTEADDDKNIALWNSCVAGKPGGTNYRNILREVARAGRLDLVLQIEPTFVLEGRDPKYTDFSWSPRPLASSAFDLSGGNGD